MAKIPQFATTHNLLTDKPLISKKVKVYPTSNPKKLPVSIYSKATLKNGTPPNEVLSLDQFFSKLSSDPDLSKISENVKARLSDGKTKKFTDWRAINVPCFVPGRYKNKGDEGIEGYSPLLVLDIDYCKDGLTWFVIDECKDVPFILAAFPSPSKEGVRIIVLADSSPDKHKLYYQAICKDLSDRLSIPLKSNLPENDATYHIDDVESNMNFSLPWFFSGVGDDIYINWKCDVFSLTEEEPPKAEERQPLKRQQGGGKYKYEFTQREKVEDMIRQIEERRLDLTPGKTGNWFRIGCALVDEFGEDGRHYFHQVSQFYDQKTKYDQKETDTQFDECLKKANGAVKIDTFYRLYGDAGIRVDYARLVEERKRRELAKSINPAPPAEPEFNPGVEPEEEEEPEEFFQFYAVKKDGDKREVKINYLRLVELLKKLGFRRYDKDGEFFTVNMTDNVVRECSTEEVIDAFENYILDFPGDELPEGVTKDLLRNKIYGSIGTYFSKNIMGRLRPEKPIVFNEHTKDKAFFFYQNAYVEVSAEGVELKPYSTLQNCIWENQMIKRDFQPMQPNHYNDLSFVKFIRNVSHGWTTHPLTKRKNENPDPARFEAFQTIIGYLMHAFFDTDLKAVIFTDSRIDEEGEANGRSGKTLLLKALGYVLNREFKKSTTYVELNGKDLKSDAQFKYQQLGLDTRLLHLNDVKRNFKFEDLFNDVTEGIKRERKNESPSIVQTKIAISTNRTIKIKGASAKGRSIEVELSEYYDDNWTPRMEFGEWFFSDWTPGQWAQFDAFLMDCVKTYFRKGLIQPETINLEERKKIEETSPEFVQWMEDKDKVFTDSSEHDKKELFEDFQNHYPDFDWLKQRKFTEWLKTYCLYDTGYHPINGETDERRSNGQNLITFRRKKTTGGEETPL